MSTTLAGALLALGCVACSSKNDAGGGGGSSPSDVGGSGGAGGGLAIKADAGIPTVLPPTCTGYGYACLVPKCSSDGVTTSLAGTVFDPSGKNPVYGAFVYIPDQPDQIADLPKGPGNVCGKCVQPSGAPIAGAVTGADGRFRMTGVPVGQQIPLVVQLGKWRRMTLVRIDAPCAENQIADSELTRLPRNRNDGQKVSMPRIAIATGAGDRMQCLLLRMGLDAAEFTNPDGPGAITLFNQPSALGGDPSGRYAPEYNGGAAFPDAAAFWSDLSQLTKYDMLFLACGGNQAATDPTRTYPNPISDVAKANLVKYMAGGGRVLAEHYNSAWIRTFPGKTSGGMTSPLGGDVASWYLYDGTDGANSAIPAGTIVDVRVDVSFPKGRAFAEWLVAAKASSVLGALPVMGEVKRTAIDQLDPAAAAGPSAQRWLYQPASSDTPNGAAAFVHHMSFNLTSSGQVVDRNATGETSLCGRFVHTGLHVDSGDTEAHANDLSDDLRNLPFPSSCAAGDLHPAEKAMEFMIFDLSSCLSLDAQTAMVF